MPTRRKPRYENPHALPSVLRHARTAASIPGVEVLKSRNGGTVIRVSSPLSFTDSGEPRADFYDIYGNPSNGR